MHTIDLTPTPAQAARTIAYIARDHGLNDLVDELTPYRLLVGWKRYEKALDALGVMPSQGTKSLHKETLRHALILAKCVPNKLIDEDSTYASVNAGPVVPDSDEPIVQATADDHKVLKHES